MEPQENSVSKTLENGQNASGSVSPKQLRYRTSESSPESRTSIENLVAYAQTYYESPYKRSRVDEDVEKARKAIYLTQKTSLKIALLLDAIVKKQSTFFRRLTGRVKPDADVVNFQAYLALLQEQEDLWSRVCYSALSEKSKLGSALKEHPEVLQALIKARTSLLRIDRDIRQEIVEPLRDSLLNGNRPEYATLHQRTETLGADALDVCKEICLQLVSVNPGIQEAVAARKREGSSDVQPRSKEATARKRSIVIPSKLRGLSQGELLDAISIL